MYAKNSVFQVASFRDLLSEEKQKKPFVSLNWLDPAKNENLPKKQYVRAFCTKSFKYV